MGSRREITFRDYGTTDPEKTDRLAVTLVVHDGKPLIRSLSVVEDGLTPEEAASLAGNLAAACKELGIRVEGVEDA